MLHQAIGALTRRLLKVYLLWHRCPPCCNNDWEEGSYSGYVIKNDSWIPEIWEPMETTPSEEIIFAASLYDSRYPPTNELSGR